LCTDKAKLIEGQINTTIYRGHAANKTEAMQIKNYHANRKGNRANKTEVKNKTEVNRKNGYGLSSRPRKPPCFATVVEQFGGNCKIIAQSVEYFFRIPQANHRA